MDRSIFMYQADYIRKTLKRYNMTEAKAVAISIEPGWDIDK